MVKGNTLQWSFTALLFTVAFFTLIVLYVMDCKPMIHQDSTMFVSWSRKVPFTPSTMDNATALKNSPRDVSIYLENSASFDSFYANGYVTVLKNEAHACQLPYGGTCYLQTSDASAQTADAVFRMVRFIYPNGIVRYHEGQLLVVLNTEADRGEYGLQQLREADIKVDHHPSSDIMVSRACTFPVQWWETSPPADPATRKGIAMFTSNCAVQWRLDYFERLVKAISIDSYGKCLHNKDEPQDDHHGVESNFVRISRKYRMVVTFENLIQDDYITEKIVNVFVSGAIPVYWGPSQIYSWVPGNHSFIDASKYKDSPEDLAKYLKLVDDDDDLFRYHTSNFDINKTKDTVERFCKNDVPFMCQTCQLVQKKLHQK